MACLNRHKFHIPYSRFNVLVESLFRFIALITMKFPVADTWPAFVSQVLCFSQISTFPKMTRKPCPNLGRHLLMGKVLQYDLMV